MTKYVDKADEGKRLCDIVIEGNRGKQKSPNNNVSRDVPSSIPS